MDILGQIISEKYSNPIEFLNQLRQTTEPIGGGMERCDNGEYVEYDVAVEAVKKAQQQLIDEACEWIKNNIHDYYITNEFEQWFDEMIEDFKNYMEGE